MMNLLASYVVEVRIIVVYMHVQIASKPNQLARYIIEDALQLTSYPSQCYGILNK